MIKSIIKSLIRKRTPIIFGDRNTLEPISRHFGQDRGTPIDRYYISKFLSQNSASIRGRGLEISELRYLSGMSNITHRSVLAPSRDVVKSSRLVDHVVIGDLTDPGSLPSSEFDCFICTQTLHVIYDFKSAIRGAHQMLAVGGLFIGTVAGISAISRYDMNRWGDYWRFTTLSMKRALQDTFEGEVFVEAFGNLLTAQMFLQGISLEDIPELALLDHVDNDYQVLIGFCARK